VDAHRLQASFARVAGFGDEFPLYFYSHLFLSHPDARVMFPATMAAQRDRLVRALVRVVGNVHQVETVVPFLQQLGRDHRKYGVTADHYPLVGRSLLAALEHFLGDEWSPELAVDWAAAYGVVADVMIRAAEEADRLTPAWYDAEVVDHEVRGPGIAVFTVAPDRRVDVRPGESVSLQSPLVPRVWRYYSPANAPRADGTLEFHVRAIDGGWLSPALVHSTGKGDVVRLGAPVGGGLSLDPDTAGDLLLLTSGTGLAPLRSLVEYLGQVHHQRVAYLFVGARSPAELYDMAALERLRDQHRWLSVVPVVGRDAGAGMATGDVAEVAVAHRNWHDHEIYVCGSDDMIARSLETLATAGIDPATVRTETYTYAGPRAGREPGAPPDPAAAAAAAEGSEAQS
jgi:NAD(P)H-flavin reductase/hemoglobin-like flavoprotein